MSERLGRVAVISGSYHGESWGGPRLPAVRPYLTTTNECVLATSQTVAARRSRRATSPRRSDAITRFIGVLRTGSKNN